MVDAAEEERRELDDLLAKQYRGILASHRVNYQQRADPFAAWGAFLICRQRGWKIPGWVMGYFDGAVKGLHDVYQAKPGKRPALLAEALGFKQRGPGGRGGRPRKTHADRNHELALEVFQARKTEGSLKAAKYVVAKAWGLSIPTVELAWSKRDRRLVPPPAKTSVSRTTS